MLDNNKSILAYGITKEEEDILNKLQIKLIIVDDFMGEMTIEDILQGLKFSIFSKKIAKEKVIVFNNFPDDELKILIQYIRKNINGCILAVVTPTSVKWKFSYLVNHLIDERNWFREQKGRR